MLERNASQRQRTTDNINLIYGMPKTVEVLKRPVSALARLKYLRDTLTNIRWKYLVRYKECPFGENLFGDLIMFIFLYMFSGLYVILKYFTHSFKVQ